MFRVSEKNGGGGAMMDSKRAPVTISWVHGMALCEIRRAPRGAEETRGRVR